VFKYSLDLLADLKKEELKKDMNTYLNLKKQ
jgi:hypothetical protein